MKILSIHLYNYIGIYNGTGRNALDIDFTGLNNIIAIRGNNGSGKSTLLKTLHPFPDSNSMLIPGMYAEKTIRFQKGDSQYVINIEYPINAHGERDTTRMHVVKDGIDCIPNGNVTESKNFVMEEFELDSNYITLSQLSSEDRGLADKKPAERKRFVNNILSDMAVYNNIYKTLTKKSSELRGIVNSLTVKINSLGGNRLKEQELEVAKIDDILKNYNENKSSVLKSIGECDFAISGYSKVESNNNELLEQEKALEIEMRSAVSEAELIYAKYINLRTSLVVVDFFSDIVTWGNNLNHINTLDFHDITIINRMNSYLKYKDASNRYLNDRIASTRSTIENNKSLIVDIDDSIAKRKSQIEDLKYTIAKIDERLSVLNENSNIDLSQIDSYKERLDSISQEINAVHEKISKKKILDIPMDINVLNTLIETLNGIVNYHNSVPFLKVSKFSTDNIKVAEAIKKFKFEKEKATNRYNEDKDNYNRTIGQLDFLENVPKECTNENCIYYRKAKDQEMNQLEVDFFQKQMDKSRKQIDEFDGMIADLTEMLQINELHDSFINTLKIYDKYFIKNILVLYGKEHLPDKYDWEDIHANPLLGTAIINVLMTAIDDMNLKEIYNNLNKTYMTISMNYNSIKDNISEIKSLVKDSEKYADRFDEAELMLDNLQVKKEEKIKEISDLKAIGEYCVYLKEKFNNILRLFEAWVGNFAEQKKIADVVTEMNKVKAEKQELSDRLVNIEVQISNYIKAKEQLNHNIMMLKEYMAEYEQFNNNYAKIETIKKYASPTTGIQTIFMEAYMNNVLILANQLLQEMFNGQFVLQPFIINESEFRIPCAGSGYLNDDISSMSTSQICIISMIISFAMMYNSSSCYNIIKLDEIDGGLDTYNRIYFIKVLERIMQILHCEQCFIISHNSEFEEESISTIEMK